VVDTTVDDSNLRTWPEFDTLFDVFQKSMYHATRRNIVKVWVQGNEVRSSA
jgi:hypothetical protein